MESRLISANASVSRLWNGTRQLRNKLVGQLSKLFNSYRSVFKKQSGKQAQIDFGVFKKMVVQRAKELKETHVEAKMAFKIMVKERQVAIQAKIKE